MRPSIMIYSNMPETEYPDIDYIWSALEQFLQQLNRVIETGISDPFYDGPNRGVRNPGIYDSKQRTDPNQRKRQPGDLEKIIYGSNNPKIPEPSKALAEEIRRKGYTPNGVKVEYVDPRSLPSEVNWDGSISRALGVTYFIDDKPVKIEMSRYLEKKVDDFVLLHETEHSYHGAGENRANKYAERGLGYTIDKYGKPRQLDSSYSLSA